jgi:hypothetical protein
MFIPLLDDQNAKSETNVQNFGEGLAISRDSA